MQLPANWYISWLLKHLSVEHIPDCWSTQTPLVTIRASFGQRLLDIPTQASSILVMSFISPVSDAEVLWYGIPGIMLQNKSTKIWIVLVTGLSNASALLDMRDLRQILRPLVWYGARSQKKCVMWFVCCEWIRLLMRGFCFLARPYVSAYQSRCEHHFHLERWKTRCTHLDYV